jgi:hypothetical protein
MNTPRSLEEPGRWLGGEWGPVVEKKAPDFFEELGEWAGVGWSCW